MHNRPYPDVFNSQSLGYQPNFNHTDKSLQIEDSGSSDKIDNPNAKADTSDSATANIQPPTRQQGQQLPYWQPLDLPNFSSYPGFDNGFSTNSGSINFPTHTIPRGPIISFMPQTISSLIEGIFACIRQNAKALFGLSLSVTALVGTITGILSIISERNVLSLTIWYEFDLYEQQYLSEQDVLSFSPLSSIFWLQILLSVLYLVANWIAGLLITGAAAIVVSKAVIGINPLAREIWGEIKQKFWTLVGTTILSAVLPAVPLVLVQIIMIATLISSVSFLTVTLFFLLSIGTLLLMLFLQFCFILAPIIAIIEGIKPLKALQRSYKLVINSFWRTLGRIILVFIVLGTLSSTITGIITLLSVFTLSLDQNPLFLFISALLLSLSSGIMWAIGSSMPSLIYIDERIRNESLAPVLLNAYQQNTRQDL